MQYCVSEKCSYIIILLYIIERYHERLTSVINSILLLNALIKQIESQLELTVIFMTTINRLIVVLPSSLMYHQSLTPTTVKSFGLHYCTH